jgi:protein TonB
MLLENVKPTQMGDQIKTASPTDIEVHWNVRSPKWWITPDVVKVKQPQADLRRTYNKVLNICMGITFVLHTAVVVVFPEFVSDARAMKKVQHVIEVENLPETRQIKRPPPPPRPAVPIETESEDVPDDATIESTDLDFDDAQVDLPPPPFGGGSEEVEDEIVEFWAVEQIPQPIKQVIPVYPEVARKAGLTGTVFVEFKVDRNGLVTDARVVRGPAIFHDAALSAILQFTFKPAIQNDKPVSVRMTKPIRFRLNNSQ